jgi:hypothetical protein
MPLLILLKSKYYNNLTIFLVAILYKNKYYESGKESEDLEIESLWQAPIILE